MKTLKSLYEICDSFDGILFDAYGVLVDESGCLRGAAELLEYLKHVDIPYWILTNGSSRTLQGTTEKYQTMGLDLSEEQVITSGSLLKSVLPKYAKGGDAIGVLGTEGSMDLVRDAGFKAVPALSSGYEVLVIANQTEYPFVESLDHVLSIVIEALDQGAPMKVILTNPDLFYPKSAGRFGITAGAIALIIEESLKLRYGGLPDDFIIKLGKPFAPMFQEAMARAGSGKLLMVGDQIHTDVKGARAAGLKAALVGSGLSKIQDLQQLPEGLRPDFFVEDLRPIVVGSPS